MLININEKELETIERALAAEIRDYRHHRDDYQSAGLTEFVDREQKHMDEDYRVMDKLYKARDRQSV